MSASYHTKCLFNHRDQTAKPAISGQLVPNSHTQRWSEQPAIIEEGDAIICRISIKIKAVSLGRHFFVPTKKSEKYLCTNDKREPKREIQGLLPHLHTTSQSLREENVNVHFRKLPKLLDAAAPILMSEKCVGGGVFRSHLTTRSPPVMEHTGGFMVQPCMTLKHRLDSTWCDRQTLKYLCS